MANRTPEFRRIRGTDVKDAEFLGNGAFGDVFKGKHTMLGMVAMKTVSQAANIDDADKQELLAEARSLARVSNKYTTLLYGVILEPGNYSLVMEFVEHGSLDKFLKKVNVPWVLKIRMIQDITCGMNFLHGFVPKIIHRDLKMQNILVNSDLHVKISDLGLSRWRTFSTKYRKTKSSAYQNNCAGTITHIPPEHFEKVSLKPDETYDVYGFGILLWEIITEKDPYREANGNNELIRLSVRDGQRPPDDDIPSDCPAWLVGLMRRCYHQEPKQRPHFPVLYSEVDTRLCADFQPDHVQDAEDVIRKALRSAAKAAVQPPSPVLAQPSEAIPQGTNEIQRGIAALQLERFMSDTHDSQTDAIVDEAGNTGGSGQASQGDVVRSASNQAPLPGTDQREPVPMSSYDVHPTTLHPAGTSSSQQAAAITGATTISENREQSGNGGVLLARGKIGDRAKSPPSAEALNKPPTVPDHAASRITVPTQDSMSLPHDDERVEKGKVVGPPSGNGNNESFPTRNRVERPETTPFQETSQPAHAPEGEPHVHVPGARMHFPYYPYTMQVPGGCMIYPAPGFQPYFHQGTMMLPGHSSPMKSAAVPGTTNEEGLSYVKTGSDGSITDVSMQGQMDGFQTRDKNVMYANGGCGQVRGTSEYRRVRPGRVVAGKPITTDTRVITKKDITVISENLGSTWRKLGRHLDFSEGKLDAFDSDYAIDGLQEKIYQMLVAWRSMMSDEATAAKLAEALCTIGKADVAVLL